MHEIKKLRDGHLSNIYIYRKYKIGYLRLKSKFEIVDIRHTCTIYLLEFDIYAAKIDSYIPCQNAIQKPVYLSILDALS